MNKRLYAVIEKKRLFSNRLNNSMTNKGFSTIQLAAHLQVSHVSIRNWSSGKVMPNYKSIVRIAKACGVNVSWLMTGKGENNLDNVHYEIPKDKPNKWTAISWEHLEGTDGELNRILHSRPTTFSLTVPGGRVIRYEGNNSMVFVPDVERPHFQLSRPKHS